VTRRILILGEGATELRAPGERWAGCARILLSRLFGGPPASLLSFDEQVLSRFRRDLDLLDSEPRVRGEDAQARIGRTLAARDFHGLVLLRDNDQSARRPHGDRRTAIERGFAEAHARGHGIPAVLALAVECIEAWALADPDAWRRAFGRVPKLPSDPEALWGNARDPASNHPKCVLRRCLDEVGRTSMGNAVSQLLAHASLAQVAARCPVGFGRFVLDLRRAFPRIACVVAASTDRAISLDGAPPWGFDTLRDHVHHLQALATAERDGSRIAAILGRKTWQALPALPASELRVDIIVTRDPRCEVPAPALRARSLDAALSTAVAAGVDRVYVVGGGELYREALGHFRCTDLHYTRVEHESPGADMFFPELETDAGWTCAPEPSRHHDNGFDYRIEHWSRFASARTT
jgi:dihydrofolate reductase